VVVAGGLTGGLQAFLARALHMANSRSQLDWDLEAIANVVRDPRSRQPVSLCFVLRLRMCEYGHEFCYSGGDRGHAAAGPLASAATWLWAVAEIGATGKKTNESHGLPVQSRRCYVNAVVPLPLQN